MTPPTLAAPPDPSGPNPAPAPATPVSRAVTAPPEPPAEFRRFTVDEYHKMLEVGILEEGDPIELLEGWLIEKVTNGSQHETIVAALLEWLSRMKPASHHLRCQSAATLADSEPEPDIAIIRGRIRDFLKRHPSAAECDLAVEVSDSSLKRDRALKARVYARAGIPVYWIVNIPGRQVEVYTNPGQSEGEPAYLERRDYLPGGEPVPVVLAGEKAGEIPAEEFLP